MAIEERKVSPFWIIPLGILLGVGAAAGIAVAMAAPRVGFSLGVINPHPDAVLWNANFLDPAGIQPVDETDSGWLGIDESWDYPRDPLGTTTLRIWALDAAENILFDFRNLGPLESGKSYVFDYATGELLEV